MQGRCKFHCLSVEEFQTGHNAKFTAVHSSTGENKDFFEATPNGDFSLSLSKDYYKGALPVPGKEYYLDISEAPA